MQRGPDLHSAREPEQPENGNEIAVHHLDVCALVGKYGRAAERAAEKLLEDEAYEAACSDAHRPEDAEVTAEAIEVLEERVGKAEAERLLRDGPRGILGMA